MAELLLPSAILASIDFPWREKVERTMRPSGLGCYQCLHDLRIDNRPPIGDSGDRVHELIRNVTQDITQRLRLSLRLERYFG